MDLFISLSARKSTCVFLLSYSLNYSYLLLLTKQLDLLDHMIRFWPNNSDSTNYCPARNYSSYELTVHFEATLIVAVLFLDSIA